MSEWEERMAERAHDRLLSITEAQMDARLREWEAERVAMEAEAGPRPSDCDECWVATRPKLGGGSAYWSHLFPEGAPFEDFTCHHECHGPNGEPVQAIAFA